MIACIPIAAAISAPVARYSDLEIGSRCSICGRQHGQKEHSR